MPPKGATSVEITPAFIPIIPYSKASATLSKEQMSEIEKVLPIGWAQGDRYSDKQWVGPEKYC